MNQINAAGFPATLRSTVTAAGFPATLHSTLTIVHLGKKRD